MSTDAFVEETLKRRPKGAGGLTPASVRNLRPGLGEGAAPLREARAGAVDGGYGLTDKEIRLLWSTVPPGCRGPDPDTNAGEVYRSGVRRCQRVQEMQQLQRGTVVPGKSSREDRNEGAMDRAKGRMKEAGGAMTGDKDKKAEGRSDQRKAKAKDKKAAAKDLLK